MAQYTSAYSGLKKRLVEINSLLVISRYYSKLASNTPSNQALPLKVNAVCRSGVVLLSGHIEGYVEDFAELVLERIVARSVTKSSFAPRFAYYFSKDIVDQIRNSGNPDTITQKVSLLFSRDADIWSNNSTFSNSLSNERFVSDFGNPLTKQIVKFFRRFGYETLQGDLQYRLKADYLACSNMVDQVVDQRNKIAHGDTVTTSTPDDLKDMLNLVERYCKALDQSAAAWFKSKGCVIR